ncbi:unnamed protein product [Trichogramma brassicae]|uniref:Uncharacterized protein n=1 Tax=Trichogramma brassicae TaxID=86971 RepID=A0A6H5J9L5_9HYME|nr:unnamed protein product [Trichogramma brassicae]
MISWNLFYAFPARSATALYIGQLQRVRLYITHCVIYIRAHGDSKLFRNRVKIGDIRADENLKKEHSHLK